MKMILLAAAALSIGGVAYAQDTTTTTTTTTDTTTAAPTGVDPNGPGVPPGSGVTQQGTVPNGQGTPPPGTNEPAPPAPPGTAVVPDPNQQAAFAPQAGSSDDPPCSKTVTDHCTQTYEHGGHAAAHASMHHRTRRHH